MAHTFLGVGLILHAAVYFEHNSGQNSLQLIAYIYNLLYIHVYFRFMRGMHETLSYK